MEDKPIVVFGSIVQDLISYTERFPRPGESVRGSGFQLGSGGKGANQAVAAARLGAKVALIAKVGNDFFGESNVKALKESGVNIDNIEKSEAAQTATATITVNGQGENSIVVTLGANLEMNEKMAERHEKAIASAALVLAQAEIEPSGNKRLFELARKHEVTTFFNPAPGDPDLDTSILSLVDIICTNENEFITHIVLKDIESTKEAAKKMTEMGPQHAIVTLGAQGILIATKGEETVEHVSVPKAEVVDTTGAGDCFCGTMAALLTKKISVVEAAHSAAAVASLSVQRKGTQSSYWRLDEIAEKHSEIKL